MNRLLVRTPAFMRAAKRFLKRHPEALESVATTLELMENDLFDPRLRTHKLKGELEGSWACSGGYDVRIVFRLARSTTDPSPEVVELLAIGRQEDVY